MMKNFTSVWKPFGLSVIFFLCVKFLVAYVVMSSFSLAIIEAEFDHPDFIDLYYSSGNGFNEKFFVSSREFSADKREVVNIALRDNVVRKLRIDVGREEGAVKLYGLKLTSFYGQSIDFDHQQLYEQFQPNKNIETFELRKDHLLITSQSNDPFLIYKGSLKVNNFFLANVLPAVFAFVFFLLITNISFPTFPAFHGLDTKAPSIGVNIMSLDGIRGLAALMVLAEHTGVLSGIGSLGVWFFFSLSGFLLATPFIKKPERAVSYSYMSHFLVRRMKRILPMYYAFLTISMVFNLKNPEFIRHFLFLQGDGHLWTLPQEMFFYLMLPFIVAASYLILRNRRALIIFFLMALIWGTNRYMTTSVVSLYGYGTALKSMAGIFIGGIMFSHVYHWLQGSRFFQKLDQALVRHSCSVLGLVLLTGLVIFSHRMVPNMQHFNALDNAGIFGFLAGLSILLVVLAKDTPLSKIMEFTPLRAIGLVSFSFYLLHPHMISLSRAIVQYYLNFRLSGLALFIVSGVLAYLFSAFTYSYIEWPFMQKAAGKK